MYIGLYIKYPSFLSGYSGTGIFMVVFFKDTLMSNFMKIHPVRVGLLYVMWPDSEADMTMQIISFCIFFNCLNFAL
jgi:hypothetical protein